MTIALNDTTRTTPSDELTAHFLTTPVDIRPIVIDADVLTVQDTVEVEIYEDEIIDGPTGIEAWLWILALGALVATVGYLYIIGATGSIA